MRQALLQVARSVQDKDRESCPMLDALDQQERFEQLADQRRKYDVRADFIAILLKMPFRACGNSPGTGKLMRTSLMTRRIFFDVDIPLQISSRSH